MGNVMLSMTFNLLAPNIIAASSKDASILSSEETIEKKTNGYRNNEETKTIPEKENMLNNVSMPNKFLNNKLSFPALGPSKIIHEIAPIKLGLAKVKTEKVRTKCRHGIFVRDTPKAIGIAEKQVKIIVYKPNFIVDMKL